MPASPRSPRLALRPLAGAALRQLARRRRPSAAARDRRRARMRAAAEAWLLEVVPDDETRGQLLFADGLEEAVIGIVAQFTRGPVLLYDRDKAIAALMADGMAYDEAEEYFSFNVEGAWVGEFTPAFAVLMPRRR